MFFGQGVVRNCHHITYLDVILGKSKTWWVGEFPLSGLIATLFEDELSRTSCDTEYPHDSDDGRINWYDSRFHLFQHNTNDRKYHNGDVELIPTEIRVHVQFYSNY